jgi:hypothetical protein
MASSVIFSTSIDMTWTVRQLAREGWPEREWHGGPQPLPARERLRFGDCITDQLHILPPAYSPTLHTAEEARAETGSRR